MAPKNQLLEEIKTVQGKFVEAEKRCNGIRTKLSELEGGQSAAHIAERTLPELMQRKQDLQAEIAMGDSGKQKELDHLNQEIARTQQEVEYHNETVAGMERKLQEAENDKTTVSYERHKLTETFIRTEAEQIGAEYMSHARSLLGLFRRLQALTHIHRVELKAGDPICRGDENKYLSIPVFLLEASGQHPNHSAGNWPQWQEARDIWSRPGVAPGDLATEKDRLEKMGITF